ncbi:hypothetical protein K3495_g7541 [Podosphaera aphanis]|nr:hypothetical protein K3495_g7541 [Podosphaera aphanis]
MEMALVLQNTLLGKQSSLILGYVFSPKVIQLNTALHPMSSSVLYPYEPALYQDAPSAPLT